MVKVGRITLYAENSHGGVRRFTKMHQKLNVLFFRVFVKYIKMPRNLDR